MIPGRGDTGHGKDQAISIGDIYEAVLHRGAVPGISGGLAVENGIYLSEMRQPPRIPTGQRTVSMCLVPSPGFGNSGDGTPQDSYATDAVVSGVLFCMSGQAGHLGCSVGGDDWNDL